MNTDWNNWGESQWNEHWGRYRRKGLGNMPTIASPTSNKATKQMKVHNVGPLTNNPFKQ